MSAISWTETNTITQVQPYPANFTQINGVPFNTSFLAANSPFGTTMDGGTVEFHVRFGTEDVHRRVKARWCLNNSGSTIPAGTVAVFNGVAASKWGVGVSAGAVSTANAKVAGIPQVAIPDGHYGWFIREGVCNALSNGTTTALVGQKVVASGQVSDATIGADEIPLFALEANASAGTLGQVYINV